MRRLLVGLVAVVMGCQSESPEAADGSDAGHGASSQAGQGGASGAGQAGHAQGGGGQGGGAGSGGAAGGKAGQGGAAAGGKAGQGGAGSGGAGGAAAGGKAGQGGGAAAGGSAGQAGAAGAAGGGGATGGNAGQGGAGKAGGAGSAGAGGAAAGGEAGQEGAGQGGVAGAAGAGAAGAGGAGAGGVAGAAGAGGAAAGGGAGQGGDAGSAGASGDDCAYQAGVSYTDYPVPASIVHDGSADASAALNEWLAASVPDGADAKHQSRVVFPADAPNTYRMDVGLQFTNRKNLVLQGNGATLRVGPTSSGKDQLASLLVLGHEYKKYWEGSNQQIAITGFHFEGNSPHKGVFGGGEFQASIELESTTQIEICGCTSTGAWGDFVKVGHSQNVRIHHNHVLDAGRNGVSVISGSDVEIDHNAFDTIGYCTFDVEPNLPSESCQKIHVHDNTAGTWAMHFFSLDGSHTGAAIDHVTVASNVVTGASLETVINNGDTGRNTDINFVGNTSTAPAVAGPVLYFAHIDGLVVTGNDQKITAGELISATDCTATTLSPNP